jgi:hypothetical protein
MTPGKGLMDTGEKIDFGVKYFRVELDQVN